MLTTELFYIIYFLSFFAYTFIRISCRYLSIQGIFYCSLLIFLEYWYSVLLKITSKLTILQLSSSLEAGTIQSLLRIHHMTIMRLGLAVKKIYLFIHIDFKVSTSTLSYLGDLIPYQQSNYFYLLKL